MCGQKCLKCSSGIVFFANLILLLCCLSGIGFFASTLFSGTSFSGLLPAWMVYFVFSVAGFGVLTGIIGLATSCNLRSRLMEVSESNEDGLTADGMEVRKGNFMCTCCFMIYFFLLTVACLLFLGIGIFGVSYLPGLTTSNEEMDTMIADAQAHRSNFTEAAISVIDTYVINTATVNPTFWYDMQGLLGCCGYFNKNLTVPPAESDYSTNQNACIAASRDATATTTNAEGCAACVTDGNAQDECTTAQHYDQCGRLSAGCPMYNGAACFSADTENQACYNLVMDFLDNSGWQIGVVSLVLWFFSTIIEFSALSLICMNCCGIVRKN